MRELLLLYRGEFFYGVNLFYDSINLNLIKGRNYSNKI